MWWYRAAHGRVLSSLADAFAPEGPILDAGCGTGGLLRRLAETYPRRTCYGIDLAAKALRHARRRNEFPLIAGSIDRLPFAPSSLAAIVTIDVLCHDSVDQAAAVAEATRCLMPGGVFIVNLPAYDWLKSAHDRQVWTSRRYVRREVAGLLRDGGLILRRLTHWNAALFLPLVAWRKLWRPEQSDVRAYPWLLDRAFRLLLAAEHGYIRAGFDLPFGSSILAVAQKP